MQTRVLGRTGLEVSVIGFGGIPICRPSREEAVKVLRRALDLGINYFDTARGYKASEERLAEALKGRREECIIASKSGKRKAEDILKDIETSLQTLGTDYIDVYKLHGIIRPADWEAVTQPGGALEGLKKAQEQGKIRYLGASGHRPEVLAEAIRSGELDVLLLIFNFIRHEPAAVLFPLAKELNVGITIMKPLGGSFLAFPDLCLRWVLQHDAVSTVCPGMWRLEEVEQNALVGQSLRPLTPEEESLLAHERARWAPIYCRLCYSHQPCPNGVPIDYFMSADMFYRRHGLDEIYERFKQALEAAQNCQNCRQCVESCPWHLPIPDLIRRSVETYEPILEEYARTHGR